MNITSILSERKKDIVDKWVVMVLETYDSNTFFKTQKDQFANPVGVNIKEALHRLYELLVDDDTSEDLTGPLDTIVRIRAVQDFTPSQAVSFVFLLKQVLREEINQEENTDLKGWSKLELRIDNAALIAFDIYMKCKQKLHQIRLDEMRKGTHVLTDGSQCASAWLKRKLKESGDNNQTKV